MNTRIKEVIKKLARSKTEFADRIGLSPQALNDYVNGERLLPTRYLIEIHKHYHVSIDWLLCGEGEMLLGPKRELRPCEKELLVILDQLPEKRVIKLLYFAKAEALDFDPS